MFARLALVGMVLLVELAPMLVVWCLMRAWTPAQAGAQPAPDHRTPNPSMANEAGLGPIDVLVLADPWFAGTIVYWIAPGALVLAAYALAVPLVLRPTRPPEEAPRWRRANVLFPTAVVLGLLFALPWIYGAWHLAG